VILKIIDDIASTHMRISREENLSHAGPTHEAIDPVRYIGNRSSGKMDSLLLTQRLRGAEVTLISGPVSLKTPKMSTASM